MKLMKSMNMAATNIPNYLLGTTTFESSIARVYIATHYALGRKVVIKAFKPEYITHEIQEKLRILAQKLTSIKHIYLTTLYDYFEQDGQSFFVQEYAQGLSLKEYLALQAKPLEQAQAILFVSKILEAMQYAHNQGIIHKDLQPTNVFITPDAQIKITDLGLASIFKETRNHLQANSTPLGNIAYLSPEQVEGKLCTEKADIYTIGILLWEMLTGKSLAMVYQNLSTQEIYQKILHENILDLPESKIIAENWQKVIAQATHKNPDQRYASCETFKQDLRKELYQPNPLTSKPNQPKALKTSHPYRRLAQYAIYTTIGIFITISLFQLLSTYNTNNKPTNLASTEQKVPKKNDNKDNTTPKAKQDEGEEKEEEEEEKFPEDKAIDSLKQEQKTIEQELKVLKENRKKEVLKDLIIDSQLEDEKFGELSILITLSNQRKEVTFKNITFHTIYTDSEGKEIETDKRELDLLKPEQTYSLKVTKSINASKFTTKLKTAEIEDHNPLPLADTLQAKMKRIDAKIEKLKETREKKRKEKEKEKEKKE